MPEKIICFDVDGTLFAGNSWQFLTAGLNASVDLHMQIYHDSLSGKISFDEGKALLRNLYLATGNANRDFVQGLFRKAEPTLEAREIISWLRDQGYIIYLVSGAIDAFVWEIAKKLQISRMYAGSSLTYDEAGALVAIRYNPEEERGKQKVGNVEAIAKDHNIPSKDILFVGDSENDVEVFKRTKGIAFRAKVPALKAVAWKEIASLLELKNLLTAN